LDVLKGRMVQHGPPQLGINVHRDHDGLSAFDDHRVMLHGVHKLQCGLLAQNRLRQKPRPRVLYAWRGRATLHLDQPTVRVRLPGLLDETAAGRYAVASSANGSGPSNRLTGLWLRSPRRPAAMPSSKEASCITSIMDAISSRRSSMRER